MCSKTLGVFLCVVYPLVRCVFLSMFGVHAGLWDCCLWTPMHFCWSAGHVRTVASGLPCTSVGVQATLGLLPLACHALLLECRPRSDCCLWTPMHFCWSAGHVRTVASGLPCTSVGVQATLGLLPLDFHALLLVCRPRLDCCLCNPMHFCWSAGHVRTVASRLPCTPVGVQATLKLLPLDSHALLFECRPR